MKKGNIFISFLIITSILINCFLVSSKIVLSNSDGFFIEPVVIDNLRLNQNYKFNLHVFNQSNGVPINSGITCYMHLYDYRGLHILKQETSTSDDLFDYEFNISGGNFSIKNDYIAKFQCNNSLLGGSSEISFNVNSLGRDLTTPESVLYVVLTIGVFLLFAIALYINIVMPWGDMKNDLGELIFISKMKYIKIGMFLITYALFVWFLNILVGISDNFVSLTLYYGFFSFVFYIFLHLSLYVFIAVVLLSLALLVRDKVFNGIIKKFGKVTK